MNLKVGDRVELIDDIFPECWKGQRGVIVAYDYYDYYDTSPVDSVKAVVVQMDRAVIGIDRGEPGHHRFICRLLRKLSVLELLAEAAA